MVSLFAPSVLSSNFTTVSRTNVCISCNLLAAKRFSVASAIKADIAIMGDRKTDEMNLLRFLLQVPSSKKWLTLLAKCILFCESFFQALTLSTISDLNASSFLIIDAPACLYVLSANDAAAPAPSSTATLKPCFDSVCTVCGVNATRRSPVVNLYLHLSEHVVHITTHENS